MAVQPRFRLARAAERDLDVLFDYIAQESGVIRAEDVLVRIERALDLLAFAPRMGRVREELDGAPRSFAVRPWIIIDESAPEDNGIYVWRVLDGRRDVRKILGASKKR